ncbi:fimbrial protein [Entomohabitans teleogrylli]|uniref:fimbrial protein n=1 Tax=Entomohabitans teleogrylli TaxID=1384589 RepID=UPI000B0BA2CF|nr:fimbrial protein [Entomohabitans teleogrylli]
MKFKYALLPVTVAALLFSASALASNGTINFTGSVVSSACDADLTISYSGGSYTSSSGTVTAQINLPPATVAALPTTGSYAGHTPFSIALTNCQAGVSTPDTVYTRFVSGQTAAGDPAVLRNTTSGGAGDVGIAILRPDSTTQININADHLSAPTSADQGSALPPSGSPGSVTLNYVAAYKALGSSVTSGAVTAQTLFEIAYY